MNNLQTIEGFLNSIGFPEIFKIGGKCPYQLEAYSPLGYQLYFRARGEIAALYLSDSSGEINFEWESEPSLFSSIRSWKDKDTVSEAGFIGEDETLPYYVLYILWSELKQLLD